jgi:hypothetical protein
MMALRWFLGEWNFFPCESDGNWEENKLDAKEAW